MINLGILFYIVATVAVLVFLFSISPWLGMAAIALTVAGFFKDMAALFDSSSYEKKVEEKKDEKDAA